MAENAEIGRWSIRVVTALLLGSAALSCGDVPASAVVHVDELPELNHVEDTRIGSVDDPVAGFSQIRSVGVSRSGEVYVLDGAAREVRIFSSEGARLGSVGGHGEGPGEFLLPLDVGLLGDTLWVFDAQAQRITWFGPDRNVFSTTPAQGVPIESGQQGLSLTVTPRYPRSDGFIESSLTRFVSQDRAVRPYTYPVVRFDRDGELVDTLRWETADEAASTFRVGGREGYAPRLEPLKPVEENMVDGKVVLDWSVPGGSTEGLLDVLRLGPDEDTLYHRELRYDPIPVPQGVLDSLISPRLAIASALGVTEREMEGALRAAVALPDFRPPVRSVHPGSDGTLWVELNSPSTEVAEWVLIGDDGSPHGKLILPVQTRIHHSALPTAWAVELDEFDVPWLVRLTVD